MSTGLGDLGNKSIKQCWPPHQYEPKEEECSSNRAKSCVQTLPGLG